jgi:GH15 family glucan-1,4-alpha-glucosidase
MDEVTVVEKQESNLNRIESAEFDAPTRDSVPTRTVRAVAYPAIERHGIIGDRRTAALISADGTLDWLCLPDYDGNVIFGALLDWGKGGIWRLGPVAMMHGEQSYRDETMTLQTEWKPDGGHLISQDAMLWPETQRAPEQEQCRVVVRSLKCLKGRVRCEFDFRPGFNFNESPEISFDEHASGTSIQIHDLGLRLWCNFKLKADRSTLHCECELAEGEELWAVLEVGSTGHGWSMEAARDAVEKNGNYWRDWVGRIRHDSAEIRRSAMMVHLLSYAPEGSVVAAPTTSLPERIGGEWNADYRLSWVRDTSLALGMLERLGDCQETERYLQWLCRRLSRFGQPLNVLYGIRGEKRPRQKKIAHACGYRNSAPVRTGNHAYKQFQIGSLGFLADCVWLYLQAGGQWRDDYWKLVRRLADYTLKHWTEADNGLWELPERQHFVYSRVLSWVALDRSVRIAEKVKPDFDASTWRAELLKIHEEVMEKGWSEQLGAFRQRYETDSLDSATLLISVLEFLPGNHPRVLATIDRIAEFLTIDGCTYRFDPRQMPVLGDFPMGQLEGAFLPCTFWLATAYAKASQPDKARAVLQRVEKVAGRLGIFAEGLDPRTGCFLGNTPLLFSHVEYVRAKTELARLENKSNGS